MLSFDKNVDEICSQQGHPLYRFDMVILYKKNMIFWGSEEIPLSIWRPENLISVNCNGFYEPGVIR